VSRGSKPGKRPAGRERGTPNRRTILVDRILALAVENPAVSSPEFITLITEDKLLPGDTRIAIGLNSVGALKKIKGFMGIVCDTAEAPQVRRKAALEVAKVLLPEKPVVKRWGAPPDEFGFAINPLIAKEYRDIDLELAKLDRENIRDVPGNARRIKKLKARQQVIRDRMQCPTPALYDRPEIIKDGSLLLDYKRKRLEGLAFTPEEDAEEAHVKARYDSYCEANPQGMAGRVRNEIRDALRMYRRMPVPKNKVSLKERALLRMLQFLYPKGENLAVLPRQQREARYAERAEDLERFWWDSELANAKPHSMNGNFYAADSKLRPPEPDTNGQFDWLGAAPIAPHFPSEQDKSFEADAIGGYDQVDLKAWIRGDANYLAFQVRDAAATLLGKSYTRVYPDIVIDCVKANLVAEHEVRGDFRKYFPPGTGGQAELPLG